MKNLTLPLWLPFRFYTLDNRKKHSCFFSSRLCVNAVSPRRLHTEGQEAEDGDGGVAARSSISYN